MPTGEMKGIPVRIDAELHAEIKAYLEAHEMTMGEFIALAAEDELHPKILEKESKGMENMRTLVFQVPEDLFQRMKDYLRRNSMTQKQFVIDLIEDELDRDEALLQSDGGEETAGEDESEDSVLEQDDFSDEGFDASAEDFEDEAGEENQDSSFQM